MKIHDKFVIELSEVIKGYGNDYRDEEPFHMPCDYKFYEINGVSICEESFKKMKRLENEINDVLDKIRAEIESNMESIIGKYDSSIPKSNMPSYKIERNKAREECISIIDKYKAEQGVSG